MSQDKFLYLQFFFLFGELQIDDNTSDPHLPSLAQVDALAFGPRTDVSLLKHYIHICSECIVFLLIYVYSSFVLLFHFKTLVIKTSKNYYFSTK